MMLNNGYGQVYAASDFGDGVPIPDLTVYEDMFPIRYGFNVGPGEKLGWTASANSNGLQSRKEGLVWSLSLNTANQIMQSPDNLGIDILDRIPQLVILRVGQLNSTGTGINDDYKVKIFNENNSVTNIDFKIEDFAYPDKQIRQIHIPIPTLSGTQIRRIKIQANTVGESPRDLLIQQIILG
tara:strand:+ start:3666 stop:4211 length:546 start_codon:yes stop_codon:yes gene_type:complete